MLPHQNHPTPCHSSTRNNLSEANRTIVCPTFCFFFFSFFQKFSRQYDSIGVRKIKCHSKLFINVLKKQTYPLNCRFMSSYFFFFSAIITPENKLRNFAFVKFSTTRKRGCSTSVNFENLTSGDASLKFISTHHTLVEEFLVFVLDSLLYHLRM